MRPALQTGRTTDVVVSDPGQLALSRSGSQSTSRPDQTTAEVVVSRLDAAAQAHRLATPKHKLHVRLSRWRQIISIGLWLALALVLVLVFVVGIQPAPLEFGQ